MRFHLEKVKSPIHIYIEHKKTKVKRKEREKWLCCTWFALQELLKVDNCLFVVLLPKHNVSHHLRTTRCEKLVLYISSKEKVTHTIAVAHRQNKPELRPH